MRSLRIKNRAIRRIGRFFLFAVLLFAGIVIFFRSPWGQDIIVSKVVGFISEKTNSEVALERLYIDFSGNLAMEGFFLGDIQGDTLVYSKSVEADIELSPLLFGNELNLDALEWEGLTANISRNADSENFNFNFLLDALIPQDTTATRTTSEPMQINLGSLDFKNFRIRYDDDYLGIDAKMQLGNLWMEANTTDLENLFFEIEEVALSNTDVFYEQQKPFVSQDTTATQLPFISVDHLKMSNVNTTYNSIPDSIFANISIGGFILELPKANLAMNEFEVDLLSLKESRFDLQLPKAADMPKDTLAVTSRNTDFVWPQFDIKATKIELEKNVLNYKAGSSTTPKEVFNPDNLSLSRITVLANDFSYRPEFLNLELQRLSFAEKSGFRLKNVSFDADLKDTAAQISDLKIETDASYVDGDVALKYTSVQEFIESQKSATVDLRIQDFQLAPQEVLLISPKLVENEYFKKAAENPLKGNINANGTLGAIQIQDGQLHWGNHTSLKADGSLKNIMQPDSLAFDFKEVQLTTIKEDVKTFISEEELGVKIPQNIEVTVSADGSLTDMNTDVRLLIPEGTAQITGNYQNQEEIKFDGNLQIDSLQLHKLLNNEQLGTIAMTMDFSGGGNNLNTLNAEFDTDFTQLEFRKYDFSNLELQGKLVGGEGDVNLNFKDDNLNLRATSTIGLDTTTSQIGLNLNVIGADLYELGITQGNIKAALQLKADYSGHAKDYTFNALVSEGIAVYENEQYQMGNVEINSHIDTIRTDVTINSDFLVGELKSNASPKSLEVALTKQFKNYFSDVANTPSAEDSVQVKLDLKVRPVPMLTEVFFRDIERLDSIVVQADFDAATQNLNAELRLPSATYKGSSVDSLNILVEGSATDLNFSAGLGALLAEPIHVRKTFFKGNLKNKELLLDFSSFDGADKIMHIASELTLEKDTTRLHINPEGLLLNKKEWAVPARNQISFGKDFLVFRNMELTRNAQKLSLSDRVAGVQGEHLGILFDNFRLQTFLSLLNPDEKLAAGIVHGEFVIKNPFGATGLISDFDINDFQVMQNPLGKLTLNGNSKGNSSYDFNMALRGGGADLDLKGDYTAAESGARLNLNLDLNRVELKVIEGFSDRALKDSQGFVSGNIDVSGTTASPEYEGNIRFNDAEFNVASLNSIFKISDENLQIDTDKFSFDDFQIGDANNSDFTIDGVISTENIFNPSFDLKLDADKFQVLNSTEEDNELFYGIASLDADMSVTGNLDLPKVGGKLRIRKVTDITYVVPESQLDVEERDGVVIFVNRENPDAILTRNDQEETPAFFQGMNVEAILEIAEDAVFNIIIDERTGDNLKVSGDAALNLNIEPNGRINLSGRYELNSGHYETSLYNLVNRKFEINPGSTITWQGDPMDAKLDVTAIYEVETSAAPLMSTVTSGLDVSIAGKYRQVLLFMVYLNVDGELLEPKLSFGLDMPEDEQGSLGGAVYSRVQQLNQQEAELNKQVFSLLALNRFYPDSGSDGSAGGTAAIARDNVNKVLSGELNAFSDKVFGNTGFEVDFDLDSFTDYQGESPQERTQLNINAKKKLFNDRLIVTAGSAVDVEGSAQAGQEETPIIGNVSLEYLLTKDGRYRLRGFRKSEYENIIDGQVIITGLAIIFNREFNRFSELFNPLKPQADEELKNERGKDEE